MRRVLLAITLVSVLAAVPSTAGAASFSMGVSSAEVTSNSALLWTRAPKSGKAQLVVGINRKFTKTRLVKKLSATKGNDLTVQSRVRHLKPAKSYYYFFFQGKQRSDIGTFRTAPKPSLGDPLPLLRRQPAKAVEQRLDFGGVRPEPLNDHLTYNTRGSMAVGVPLCP